MAAGQGDGGGDRVWRHGPVRRPHGRGGWAGSGAGRRCIVAEHSRLGGPDARNTSRFPRTRRIGWPVRTSYRLPRSVAGWDHGRPSRPVTTSRVGPRRWSHGISDTARAPRGQDDRDRAGPGPPPRGPRRRGRRWHTREKGRHRVFRGHPVFLPSRHTAPSFPFRSISCQGRRWQEVYHGRKKPSPSSTCRISSATAVASASMGERMSQLSCMTSDIMSHAFENDD